jgi:uncharacterized membrane protein
MTLANLIIGNRDWLLPSLGLFAVALFVLWQAYRNTSVDRRIQLASIALKTVGFALLVAFLVEPLWSGTRARPGANIFLLLADNSQSLTIRDDVNQPTRGETLKRLLNDNKADWRVRLEQDFDVRQYLLDDQLRRTPDFTTLDFQGTATSLAAALQTIRERFHNRPLAGVLLMTDGAATDLDANLADFNSEDLPPIYPVLFGASKSPRDVAVNNVSISQTAFEDAPVTVRADITRSGYQNSDIIVQLLDSNGKAVQEQTISATDSDGDSAASVRFKLRPTTGVSFYRVRVFPIDERDAFETSGASSEATLANNTRLIKIDRGPGAHRVLYVSGRPNWEYKFLSRAVEKDDQIALAALIRIAKREAKFDFRGRTGESNNSLFRGFKKEIDAETEQYDQPVLVRLNMKDAAELRDGFPKSERDLYRFDAIVIDDLEAAFFSQDQLELLERFVSERGGGLLMLGGQESFRNGGYARTPVGDMLPVYLDRVPAARPDARYRLTLTRDGWLQPWVRLRANKAEELTRFEQMPEFRTSNRVGAVKPGALVLAHAVDDVGKQLPALVVQRYGRGRCAALTIGDLWRWQLQRADETTDDAAKAWRQMLRWLVADVPHRVELAVTSSSNAASTALTLRTHVFDNTFQPLDSAAVKLTITPPSGKPIIINAEPSLDEPGVYQAVYVPREPGPVLVEANVENDEGKPVGTVQSGWAGNPAADEFQQVKVNRALMSALAEKTGGEVIAVNDLNRFVHSLSTRHVPIEEPWTFPLWHQAWVMLMAIGCFVSEWGLRRWKGLA